MLISFKILQARLQQYVKCELPDVQAGLRKGRGTRDQTANIRWIIEKAREFQNNIYFCFIDYITAFDWVDRNKLWKILEEMWIQSLGREDPLEEETATHSTILAWRIPWTEEPSGLRSIGSQRVGYN